MRSVASVRSAPPVHGHAPSARSATPVHSHVASARTEAPVHSPIPSARSEPPVHGCGPGTDASQIEREKERVAMNGSEEGRFWRLSQRVRVLCVWVTVMGKGLGFRGQGFGFRG